MSILVKGMEMPIKGYRLILIHADGTVQSTDGETTAVSVPPHGRLIDADAIPYKKIMYEDDDFYYGVTKPYIDRMPTVIPADKDGET